MEYEASDSLKELLARQGLRADGAGTPKRRKEIDGRSHIGAARQSAAATGGVTGQEGRSGVRLVWSQEATTAMRKTARRKTSAAFLMIEGGKR